MQQAAAEKERLRLNEERVEELEKKERMAHEKWIEEREHALEEAAKKRAEGPLQNFGFGDARNVHTEIAQIVDALENQDFDFQEGERNVVVIGSTGSGKSTLINWLCGCELRSLTETERSELGLDFSAVCVDKKGAQSEICEIGHGNVSRTQSVKKVLVDGTHIVVWDFPGFFDTGGPTTEIIHAAILSKFMNDPLSSGLILMLTTQESDLAAARGQLINQVIQRLENIFGGERMRLELGGVIFCLTKPAQLTEPRYRTNIESALTERWASAGSRIQTIVFDPLNVVRPASQERMRKEMLDVFNNATPIQGNFRMALEAVAEERLREIVHFSIDHVQRLVFEDEPSSSKITAAFQNLEMISAIQHQIVSEGMVFCRSMIVNCVRQGRATVERCCYSLQQDPDNVEKRSRLRKSLNVQEELCNLKGFTEDQEFAKIFDECRMAVKNCESAIQMQELSKLDSDFRSCVSAFNSGIIACDAKEILGVWMKAGIDSSTTFQMFETEFLGVLRELVPATTNIIEQLDEMDRRLEMRQREDAFLYGDQHDFKSMMEKLKHDFLAESLDRMERMQKETVEEQFRRCYNALKGHTAQVIDDNYVQIGDQHQMFQDFMLLEQSTFSKTLESLGFDSVLISEVQQLLSSKADVLESLSIMRQLREWFFAQIVAPSIQRCLSKMCLDQFEQTMSRDVLTNDEARSRFEKENYANSEALRAEIVLAYPDYIPALELLEKIAHEWSHSHATQMVQQIRDKEAHVLDALLRVCRQQKSIACIRDISAVLAEGKLASEANQDKILSGLVVMRECNPDEYKNQIEQIQKHIASMQSPEEIQRLFTEKRDNELSQKYQILQSLHAKLKEHLVVDGQPIVAAVQKQFLVLIRQVEVELNRKTLDADFLELESTRRFGSAIDHFSTLFPLLLADKNVLLDTARQQLQEAMTSMEMHLGGENSSEHVQTVARLLIKNWGVSQELRFSDEFVVSIQQNLLKKLNADQMRDLGEALKDLRASRSDMESSKLASEVLAKFPEFVSIARELLNELAGSVTFDDALDHPDFKTIGETLDKDCLRNVYKAYDSMYEKYVNAMCDSIQNYPVSNVKKQIKTLSKSLKDSRTSLSKQGQKLGELIALVSAQFSYLTATSEGASDLKRKSVRQPYATQILGILCLLGVGSPNLADRLVQIGTGEGKSVALGMTSVLLSLLGFSVDVVCYSRYLSERDYAEFKNLFQDLGVLDMISYYDINQLTSKNMATGTNMPNARDAFQKFLRKGDFNVRELANTESILLMDEVDVFFDKNFYGAAYRPSRTLQNSFPLIKRIWNDRGSLTTTAHILRLEETKQLLDLYPNLNLSPDGKLSFLELEVKDILEALSLFPASGNPNLDGDSNRYTLDERTKRIGYIDSVSGVPDFSVSWGYVTTFTYMHAIDSGGLAEEDLWDTETLLVKERGLLSWLPGLQGTETIEERYNILGLQPRCGTLSYSEIPKSYKYKFGMSGTLNCLTPTQNDILSEFGFRVRTDLPSTFQKQQIDRLPIQWRDQEQDDFFDAICKSAHENASDGKAVLVILEDEKRVGELQKFIKDKGKQLPDDQVPLELTGRLDRQQRDRCIGQSTRHRQITFVTRTYGRGTDFVCHDARVKKFGGVHLIISFYPSDDSEARQLEGRTCRRDDPGSSEYILWSDDHEHLGSDKPDFKPAPSEQWEDYLRRRREESLASKFEQMKKDKDECLRQHKLTVDACKMMQKLIGASWESIAKKFGEAAALPIVARPSVGGPQGYHVVFVLDESSSMVRASIYLACVCMKNG